MDEARVGSATSGYVALLRANPSYRNLWLGQVVSLLGDWFNLVATATLVQQLTGSSAQVGLLFALRMLAPFLVSPFAGVVADRFDRRRVLIVTDLLRAAVVLCFVLVKQPGDVWMLYVLTFVQLGLSGFFFPTQRAILPDVVPRRDLGTANALGSATWSTMLAFGAAAGGIVAGQFGVYPSFVIDCGTFLLSAFFLARVRVTRTDTRVLRPGVAGSIHEYFEGLRYLRRHVDVALVACHKAANSLLVAGGFQVVQVALAEQVFVIGEGGSAGMGWIWSMVGLGTGFGPIIARRFTGDDDVNLRRVLAYSYFITCVGLIVVAAADVFAVVLIGALLRGIGAGMGWVFSTQLLLHLVPDRVRGRVFSTEFAMLTLSSAIGSFAAGWAVDQPGVWITGSLLTMAALVLVPGFLWTAWTLKYPAGLSGDAEASS